MISPPKTTSSSSSPSSVVSKQAEETEKKSVAPKSKDDLVVDAEKKIVFDEEKNLSIAMGNAIARKGDTTLRAPLIKVYFKGKGKERTIHHIEAMEESSGSDCTVILENPSGRVQTKYLLYTAQDEMLHARGGRSTLQTPSYFLEADRICYSHSSFKGHADGKALFRDADKTLYADHITAYFENDPDKAATATATAADAETKDDSEEIKKTPSANPLGLNQGSLRLKKAYAKGNVVLIRDPQIARSTSAVYDATSGLAELTGNVKIEDGKNFGTGDRAIFDTRSKKAFFVRTQPCARVRLMVTPKTLRETSKKRDSSSPDKALSTPPNLSKSSAQSPRAL